MNKTEAFEYLDEIEEQVFFDMLRRCKSANDWSSIALLGNRGKWTAANALKLVIDQIPKDEKLYWMIVEIYVNNGYHFPRSIIIKAMATSYPALLKQAGQNQKTNDQLDNWVSKGLALTNMKIVSSAENQNITWDNHGLLAREYLPITDSFDDKQLKLINKGLFMTNDNWLTSKAGIGNFTFYNPESGQFEESYGVIADTLVGNLILGERVGVYNTEGSITLGKPMPITKLRLMTTTSIKKKFTANCRISSGTI